MRKITPSFNEFQICKISPPNTHTPTCTFLLKNSSKQPSYLVTRTRDAHYIDLTCKSSPWIMFSLDMPLGKTTVKKGHP